MLKHTFLHLPGVSENKEAMFWKNRIMDWDSLVERGNNLLNSDAKKHILLSIKNYEEKNPEFFSANLLSRYHWRAYDDFKEKSCFLDIETTGLDKDRNELTVIGLYDGKNSKIFINGQNLEQFEDEIKKYSYIVTFNGLCFDVPFIKAKFPHMKLSQFHADLRYIMRAVGYSGGLKRIEKDLGIARSSETEGMTGLDAVRLWHLYKRYNDKKALDLLVKYNIEDISNLKYMMDFAYEKMKEKTLGPYIMSDSQES